MDSFANKEFSNQNFNPSTEKETINFFDKEQTEISQTELSNEANELFNVLSNFLLQIENNHPDSLEFSICIFNFHVEFRKEAFFLLKSLNERISKLVFNSLNFTIKRNLLLFLIRLLKKSKIENFNQSSKIIEDFIKTKNKIMLCSENSSLAEEVIYFSDILEYFIMFPFDDSNILSKRFEQSNEIVMKDLIKIHMMLCNHSVNIKEYYGGKTIEFFEFFCEEMNCTFAPKYFKENCKHFFDKTFFESFNQDQLLQASIILVVLTNSEINLGFIDKNLIKSLIGILFESMFNQTNEICFQNNKMLNVNLEKINHEEAEIEIFQLMNSMKLYLINFGRIFEGPFFKKIQHLFSVQNLYELFLNFCQIIQANDKIIQIVLNASSHHSTKYLKTYLKNLSLGFKAFTNCTQIHEFHQFYTTEQFKKLISLVYCEVKKSLIACNSFSNIKKLFMKQKQILDDQLKALIALLDIEEFQKDKNIRSSLSSVLILDELTNIFDYCVSNFEIFGGEISLEIVEILINSIQITKKVPENFQFNKELISKVFLKEYKENT